ncbi:terpene synthase family protein [Nocardia brasiliensis]
MLSELRQTRLRTIRTIDRYAGGFALFVSPRDVRHFLWITDPLWKFSMQHSGISPSVYEYLKMRWFKSGADILAACTAPFSGHHMTPEEYRDPLVRAFTKSVYYPLFFFNDVISLAKEIPEGQADMNIVTALAREHGIDPLAALVKVWELSERLVRVMMRLRERLMADPRSAVARYAEKLSFWLPATLHWTSISAQYMELPGASGDIRVTPPTVTMTETSTLWDPADSTPQPYPEIAWWRDLLANPSDSTSRLEGIDRANRKGCA